jgi:hypothetical protein
MCSCRKITPDIRPLSRKPLATDSSTFGTAIPSSNLGALPRRKAHAEGRRRHRCPALCLSSHFAPKRFDPSDGRTRRPGLLPDDRRKGDPRPDSRTGFTTLTVTDDIEEATLMATRVLVFNERSAVIKADKIIERSYRAVATIAVWTISTLASQIRSVFQLRCSLLVKRSLIFCIFLSNFMPSHSGP